MEGINQLAKQIHKNNIEKGFYEEPKDIGEMIALIHSEVSEALECDRKGKMTKQSFDMIELKEGEGYKAYFEAFFKDTFEDEMADVFIRLVDLLAYMEINIEEGLKRVAARIESFGIEDVFGARFYGLTESEKPNTGMLLSFVHLRLSEAFKRYNQFGLPSYIGVDFIVELCAAVYLVKLICEKLQINLMQHVHAKVKYNTLRAYKHGKKY